MVARREAEAIADKALGSGFLDRAREKRNALRKSLMDKAGGWEGMKKSLESEDKAVSDAMQRVLEKIEAACDRRWQKLVAPLDNARKEVLAGHPLKDKPDPTCPECKGTGKYKSTYNPKSQWDWYQVGGRWDGAIKGNSKPVKALLAGKDRGFIPFAIVTPDGEWHEKGEMGWWGLVSNEKNSSKWDKEAIAILGKNKTCVAVGVDCHI